MTTSAQLQTRRAAAVPRGVGNITQIYADRAEGALLFDVDGRRYIDFAAGIAVLNTGHTHPAVTAAVARQLERFSHSCFHVAPYEGYVALAEKLNALMPGPGPNQTLLATTGAEAVENAVKIARAYTGRAGVIAFRGGFHGRTLLGMALTGKVAPYKAGFGPFPPEIFHAPFPNPYRGVSVEMALQELDALLRTDIDPQRVAALIVEPVQGEGGFNIAPAAWLQGLRRIADTHGMLLIVDEIQTGFARTGKMFAIEHAGVAPDLMTMAKSLAGGFPLSAVTGRREIMDAVGPGGLGGTYAGSPLGCAAALAVLEVIEAEGLCARARRLGVQMVDRLKAMDGPVARTAIGDIRHLGAMVAMELVQDRDRRIPDPARTAALVAGAAARGVIVLSCGTYGNVIRFLPPLVTDAALIDSGLDIIEEVLEHDPVRRNRLNGESSSTNKNLEHDPVRRNRLNGESSSTNNNLERDP